METITKVQEIKSYYTEHKRLLVICLGVIALTLALVIILKLPVSTLIFIGVVLICPLLHVWMVRNGDHKH